MEIITKRQFHQIEGKYFLNTYKMFMCGGEEESELINSVEA